MDLIKQEIMKKRQALAEETGGKRFFKRSEIEQKRLQKVLEEEKRELEEKSRRQESSSSSSTASLLDLIYSAKSNTGSSSKTATLTAEEQNNIDELNLPRQEVIRRLRLLKQPITLFGEDDQARLDRLKYVLKTGSFEVDSDLTEGQTNDFLRDIVELKKMQKTGMGDRKRKSEDMEDGEGGKGDDDLSGDGASSGVDADKDIKLMKAKFEDLCEEDKILVFFKRLLNEWRQELDEMENIDRRTAKGKQMVATFKQCARYLTPLFKFCRKRALPDDIKKALMFIVDCCVQRDYRTAVDHYIKLAIGNAPWPIGVTMVGIHERSAREKIYTNSVAHIMNDETTRKYLQSVKRLVTFCQRKYPTVPSKSIEFNSLANGSDLQALLMDEHYGGEQNNVAEEMLQLPAPSTTQKRGYLTWTPQMDAILASTLIEQITEGNEGDGDFKPQAYQAVVDKLRDELSMQITTDHAKNRLKIWKKHHATITDIRTYTKFKWNEEKKMIEIEPQDYPEWLKYCKEKLYQWVFRQQEAGARVTTVDILNYLQNELDISGDEPSMSPRGPVPHHHHSQAPAQFANTGFLLSGPSAQFSASQAPPRSEHCENQPKNTVFSNALSSPVRRTLQHYHLAQGGHCSSGAHLPPPGNVARSNENSYANNQNRDSNSNVSFMDMH